MRIFIAILLLLTASCKQQKPGEAKLSAPIKKVYKETTDDFWKIIDTEYENSSGATLKWDFKTQSLLW